jgi:hypothetical protein
MTGVAKDRDLQCGAGGREGGRVGEGKRGGGRKEREEGEKGEGRGEWERGRGGRGEQGG